VPFSGPQRVGRTRSGYVNIALAAAGSPTQLVFRYSGVQGLNQGLCYRHGRVEREEWCSHFIGLALRSKRSGSTPHIQPAIQLPFHPNQQHHGRRILPARIHTSRAASPGFGRQLLRHYQSRRRRRAVPQPSHDPCLRGNHLSVDARAAMVTFSGLAPGFVGLNQVNVVVPSGLASRNQAVIMNVGGHRQ